VKTLRNPCNIRYFQREKSIHERLSHPLIVGFEGYLPPMPNRRAQIVTEFVPNGSLADHLPSAPGAEFNQLTGGTRIAIVVTGIVLAMRYLHFCRIIHRDLKPQNILLDWDWNIRICDFSHAVMADACGDAKSDEPASLTSPPSMDIRYTAPESINGLPTLKSDVFSFGSVLLEVLTGKPPFSPGIPPLTLLKQILLDQLQPEIPEFIFPKVQDLILDCWEERPSDRPSFGFILWRLNKMEFRITPGVRAEKVREFVSAVKRQEELLGIEIDDFD
jgi:serine/threonine-protein kinase